MKFRFAYLVLPALLIVGFGCSKPATTSTEGNAAIGGATGPSAGANANAGTTTPPTPPTPSGTGTPSSGDGRTVTISLKAGAGEANEWGTATLTDLAGNQTRIDLVMANAPKDEAQTAAIHSGPCSANEAQVQYALNPVVKGKSSTTLNVNLTALLDKTGQSIRVKADAVDAMVPLAACGNLN